MGEFKGILSAHLVKRDLSSKKKKTLDFHVEMYCLASKKGFGGEFYTRAASKVAKGSRRLTLACRRDLF